MPLPAHLVRMTVYSTLSAAVGIDLNVPQEPMLMVRDTDFFELLERVAHEDVDGRAIAIRVGAAMRCDDYGAFGLAFKSAINLQGSCQRVERYGKVVTSIANYTVIPGNGSTFMAVQRSDVARLGLDMTIELAVAAATALCREVSLHDFSPVSVHFSHDAPPRTPDQDAHFQCQVQYGSDRDGFEISEQCLHAGNRLGDARISEFFDSHLEKALTEVRDESHLARQACEQIANALSEGVPTIAAVAKQLGLSSRTLQRRLAEEGYAFQGLVETARRDLAERLLSHTEFALAEIAFLTGYAEQSTFSRAFKRWHGQTPAQFRRTRQSP